MNSEIKTLVSLKYKTITTDPRTWKYIDTYPREVIHKWTDCCLTDIGWHLEFDRIASFLVQRVFDLIYETGKVSDYGRKAHIEIFTKYTKWLFELLCEYEENAPIKEINI